MCGKKNQKKLKTTIIFLYFPLDLQTLNLRMSAVSATKFEKFVTLILA